MLIFERWPIGRLNAVVDGAHNPHHRRICVDVLQALSGADACWKMYKVVGSTSSRLYAEYPSKQQLPSILKRFIYNGKCSDLDFRNCFFELLAQCAGSLGIDCGCLTEMNTNRQLVYEAFSDCMGVSMSIAKSYYLRMLHGGDSLSVLLDGPTDDPCVVDLMQAEIAYPFNLRLRNNLTDIYNSMSVVYVDEHARAKSAAELAGSSNVMGRFFHIVLSGIESACLLALVAHLATLDILPVALMYDGVNVDVPDLTPLDCLAMSDAVFTATGYRLDVVRKSMEFTDEDRARLFAPRVNPVLDMIPHSIHDDPYVMKYTHDKAPHILQVAPMGTGKTHQLRARCQIICNSPAPYRILLLTCRQLMAEYLFGLLNGMIGRGKPVKVCLYHNSSPTDILSGQGIFIFEYESLYKLVSRPEGCEVFSDLMIDEVSTLMTTMTSSTNKKNLNLHFDILRGVMRSAKRSIFMCADMLGNATVSKFLLSVHGRDKLHAYVYTTTPVIHTYLMYDQKMHKVEWYEAIDLAIATVKDDPQAPLVVLVCRCKSHVDQFVERIKERTAIDCKHVLTITRDTPQHEMAAFQDINAYIKSKDIRVICNTTRMAGAADIQIPAIVFMDLCGFDGGDTRSLVQASGRCRKLPDKTIHVLLPSRTVSCDMQQRTVEQSRNMLDVRDGVRVRRATEFLMTIQTEVSAAGLDVLTLRPPTDSVMMDIIAAQEHDRLKNARGIFSLTFCEAVAEKKHKLRFFRLAADEDVVDAAQIIADRKECVKEESARRKTLSERHKMLEAEMFAELVSHAPSIYDLERQHQELNRSQLADGGLCQSDCVKLDMLSVMLRFPTTFESLTIDDVRWVSANIGLLFFAKSFAELTDDRLLAHETKTLASAQILPVASMMVAARDAMTTLVQFGGMSVFGPTVEFEFDADDLVAQGKVDQFMSAVSMVRDTLSVVDAGGTPSYKPRINSAVDHAEAKFVLKVLKGLVRRFGYELDKAPGHRRARLVVSGMVKRLAPRAFFHSLDPDAPTYEALIQELRARENQYAKARNLAFRPIKVAVSQIRAKRKPLGNRLSRLPPEKKKLRLVK